MPRKSQNKKYIHKFFGSKGNKWRFVCSPACPWSSRQDVDDGQHFIQCDSCDASSHSECMGFSPTQAKALSKFKCLRCEQNAPAASEPPRLPKKKRGKRKFSEISGNVDKEAVPAPKRRRLMEQEEAVLREEVENAAAGERGVFENAFPEGNNVAAVEVASEAEEAPEAGDVSELKESESKEKVDAAEKKAALNAKRKETSSKRHRSKVKGIRRANGKRLAHHNTYTGRLINTLGEKTNECDGLYVFAGWSLDSVDWGDMQPKLFVSDTIGLTGQNDKYVEKVKQALDQLGQSLRKRASAMRKLREEQMSQKDEEMEKKNDS